MELEPGGVQHVAVPVCAEDVARLCAVDAAIPGYALSRFSTTI